MADPKLYKFRAKYLKTPLTKYGIPATAGVGPLDRIVEFIGTGFEGVPLFNEPGKGGYFQVGGVAFPIVGKSEGTLVVGVPAGQKFIWTSQKQFQLQLNYWNGNQWKTAVWPSTDFSQCGDGLACDPFSVLPPKAKPLTTRRRASRRVRSRVTPIVRMGERVEVVRGPQSSAVFKRQLVRVGKCACKNKNKNRNRNRETER